MRKLKLNATAAGIALVLSGSANAVLPGVQTEVFMSGASAPSNMLRENIVQFACDKTQPIDVYVDFADQLPGNGDPALAEPIVEHRTFWTVQCTANSTMGSAAGTNIAFYKSDVGGSGNGTTPVHDAVPLQFMDANKTNCALKVSGQAQGNGGTYDLYECTQNNLVLQAPDVGASDVEASKFVGPLAPASGDFDNADGAVQEKVGPGLIFGPIVTTSLRNELQRDQIAAGMLAAGCEGDETEACMPSLPSTVVRGITAGKYNKWSDISVYGQQLNVPAAFTSVDPKADNVHLCRRVKGSGTHAEYMMHYHRTNCYVAAQSMLSQPGSGTGFFPGPLVYENSSSGTLGSCLDAIENNSVLATTKITPNIDGSVKSFGFGYQSTEKNIALAKDFRYVKVDMKAPTLANAIHGDYRQVYYSGFQNRTGNYVAGALRSADADTVKAQAIQDIFENSTNINSSIVKVLNKGFVHTWGASGFLVPDATAPTVFTNDDPRTPWTRENAGGFADSCQPLFKKL